MPLLECKTVVDPLNKFSSPSAIPPSLDLSVNVEEAPSINGKTTYELRLTYRTKHWSVYKTKQNLQDILTLMKTLYWMLDTSSTPACASTSSSASAIRALQHNAPSRIPYRTHHIHCDVCSTVLAAYPYLTRPCSFDVQELSVFFNQLLMSLRRFSMKELEACSLHMGAVKIITSFFQVKDYRLLNRRVSSCKHHACKEKCASNNNTEKVRTREGKKAKISKREERSEGGKGRENDGKEEEEEIEQQTGEKEKEREKKETDTTMGKGNQMEEEEEAEEEEEQQQQAEDEDDDEEDLVIPHHGKLSSCLDQQFAAFDSYC